MKNKENIVAFDLDGTLLDSADDLINCLNLILKEEGKNTVKKKNIHNLLGNGALAMIKEAFKINHEDLNKYEAERLTKKFLFYYKNECVKKSKLFPHTLKTLEILKKNKFKLLLVSNKPEYFVKKILKHFNIYKFFSAISGGDTFDFRKPDHRHLLETIKKAKINNYKCWFIGDSKNDALCAKKSKSKLILLKHGYSKDNLLNLGADYVLSNLKEVSKKIIKDT
jgi:phosphoglycolate phosphatase